MEWCCSLSDYHSFLIYNLSPVHQQSPSAAEGQVSSLASSFLLSLVKAVRRQRNNYTNSFWSISYWLDLCMYISSGLCCTWMALTQRVRVQGRDPRGFYARVIFHNIMLKCEPCLFIGCLYGNGEQCFSLVCVLLPLQYVILQIPLGKRCSL